MSFVDEFIDKEGLKKVVALSTKEYMEGVIDMIEQYLTVPSEENSLMLTAAFFMGIVKLDDTINNSPEKIIAKLKDAEISSAIMALNKQ